MSSTSIQVFNNDRFGHLRATTNTGEPWFIAKDIAIALGYHRAHDLTRTLDDDEKGVYLVRTPGGDQLMVTISEAGLYKALLQRKAGWVKDEKRREFVRAYQRWVTHEVLPSIRATGSYSTEDESLTMARGLIAAQGIVKRLQAENDDLTEQAALMAPKAAYYDAVMDADGLLSVRDSAKLLKSYDPSATERGLRANLRRDRIIERRTRKATAYGIGRGYVKERPFSITHHDGRQTIDHYGCLTPKGLDWCIRRYCQEVA